MHRLFRFCSIVLPVFILGACSSGRFSQAAGTATAAADPGLELLQDSALQSAHVGISIVDLAAGTEIYGYQANKYFVPASNTKIPSCYAAMKYLGDSSLSFRYVENDTAVFIEPAGDPSFMHRDFKTQPGIDWLKSISKSIYFTDHHWKSKAWGSGWSWSDFDAAYMAERSPMPVYGNTIVWEQAFVMDPDGEEMQTAVASEPATDWQVFFSLDNPDGKFRVTRALAANEYTIYEGKEGSDKVELPFVTNGLEAALPILSDSLQKPLGYRGGPLPRRLERKEIYSQPIDSILKPMMHRSDNFFAEQLLLMTSYRLTGQLEERLAIDSLLKTDFADLPQRPRWVDGSGLSRYNLFSPGDFVAILQKMEKEFGMNRIKGIFASGGTGTLYNYYRSDTAYLYAKTGTLSGVVALSGFLQTDQGKQLAFSVLVNNHQASASDVRRAVEQFLLRIKATY